MRKNLKLASLFFAVSALLAGCGGNNDVQLTQPTLTVQKFDQLTVGAWLPATAGADVYEFYSSSTDLPYNRGKTGRVYSSGVLKNFFTWDIQGDGSVKMTTYAPTCSDRPVSLCAATGTATIVATGESIRAGQWNINFDDNADGVVDRKVVDIYARKDLDLSRMAEGEFFLTKSELFDFSAYRGQVSGKKLSIRVTDYALPIVVTGDLGAGSQTSIKLTASAPIVVPQSFNIPGAGNVEVPVQISIDKPEIMAAANGGFIFQFEQNRKILLPGPVDPSMQSFITDYEKPQIRTRSMALISKFIQGPIIRPGDKYNTFILLDFNPEWVAASAGNEIQFTSSVDGVVAHQDFNKGKFSESRKFKWVQRSDGEVVLTFENNTSATIRFVKSITGGYYVVLKTKDPLTGRDRYVAHDMFLETQTALAERDVPGRYGFISVDGTTINEVTLHRNKTVTGVVGGFWFMDVNGDVVSYQCTDLQGKPITNYVDCEAAFARPASEVGFAHIRRLRFMHKDGNNYQVKYDAILSGVDAGIVDRDYFTITWTYRWTRLGDE
jgi:hypothetical protein